MESARPIFEFFEREVKIGLGRKKNIKIGLLGNVNDIISYLSYDIIECFLTMWSATPYKLPWGHIKHSLGSTCYYNHFALPLRISSLSNGGNPSSCRRCTCYLLRSRALLTKCKKKNRARILAGSFRKTVLASTPTGVSPWISGTSVFAHFCTFFSKRFFCPFHGCNFLSLNITFNIQLHRTKLQDNIPSYLFA